jgi:hypothetical protein
MGLQAASASSLESLRNPCGVGFQPVFRVWVQVLGCEVSGFSPFIFGGAAGMIGVGEVSGKTRLDFGRGRNMRFHVQLCATLASVLLTCAAFAQRTFETSDDGHETVVLKPSETDGMVITQRSFVPYGTAPDWENSVRRQVGSLKVADMNGDGWNDVVVGCYISNSFPPYDDWHNLIYYNTGGALEPNASWVSDDQVSTGDIQVGDINGDTFPDVFAANGGFPMDASVIYFGSASGPSTTPGWSSNEPALAWNNYAIIFDVDHDNDMDVVTANQGNSPEDPYRPMFMFNNDNGTLDTVPSWQSDETSIQNYLAFADYDGDGWEDLAVSKWSGFESAIYPVSRGVLATVPSWTTGDTDSDKGVAWADVDDNNFPDLALGHDPTLLYSNNAGVLTQTWSSGATFFGHNEMTFHDVDGDGDQDLAEVHFSDGKVHIYLNEGGVLSTAPSWTYDSPTVGTAIAFGDINGDDLDDLVTGNSGEPCVKVFYAVAPPCPGDLDGDSDVDLDDLTLLLQAFGTSTAGDIDGDGDTDLDDLTLLLQAFGTVCA